MKVLETMFPRRTGSVSIRPSVAVIVPSMDRSADLRASLPRMLHQDFENHTVYLVDNSSIDELHRVLRECERLTAANVFGEAAPLPQRRAGRASRLRVMRGSRAGGLLFAVSPNFC